MFTRDETCSKTQSRITLDNVMLNSSTILPINIILMKDISLVYMPISITDLDMKGRSDCNAVAMSIMKKSIPNAFLYGRK